MGTCQAERLEQARGNRDQIGLGVRRAPRSQLTDRPVSRWSYDFWKAVALHQMAAWTRDEGVSEVNPQLNTRERTALRTTASFSKDWASRERRLAATDLPGLNDGGGLTPDIPSRRGSRCLHERSEARPGMHRRRRPVPGRTARSWIGAGGHASSAGKRSQQLITRTSRSSAASSPSGARLRAGATRVTAGNTRSRSRSRSNERARWRFCPTSVIPRSSRRDLARATPSRSLGEFGEAPVDA